MTSPPSDKTRPTEDRVRQALFNILGPRVNGARVLDFYAGTGALGIEALSRGADYAVFLENNPRVQRTLRANLTQIPLRPDAFRIMPGDALRSAKCLASERALFDLIFLDPPYESGLYEPSLSAIQEGDLLSPGGIVLIEHSVRIGLPSPGELWRIEKVKVYGETALEFWGLMPREA